MVMHCTRYFREYESEFARFIDELKKQHPEIEDSQREARALWWDKRPLKPEEIDRACNPEVKVRSYPYD